MAKKLMRWHLSLIVSAFAVCMLFYLLITAVGQSLLSVSPQYLFLFHNTHPFDVCNYQFLARLDTILDRRGIYCGRSHLPFFLTQGENSTWKYRQPFESFQPRIPANAARLALTIIYTGIEHQVSRLLVSFQFDLHHSQAT